MNKNKKLAILLPILIIVSIFVWGSNIKTMTKKEKPASAGNLQFNQNEILALIKQDEQGVEPAQSSFEEWGQCPFTREIFHGAEVPEEENTQETEEVVSAKVPEFSLAGIFWNKEKPCAIINNELVWPDMSIEGYAVVSLSEVSVTLSNGENDVVLTLDK